MAAAAAAFNRPPPAHPGPNTENLSSYYNSSRAENSGQQDPGQQGTNRDVGPHMSARPVLYVPVPPPHPFLHYQWPMPFSYNPFTGFPGMGYGMVMPPIPPPLPFMEAPAYVLPHPHIQPLDTRRFPYPSVPVPAAPYQYSNQTRRVRPPHAAPVRETTNSGVQTDPRQRSSGAYGEVSPLISSDSGCGNTSNNVSPSSSHKQDQAEAETLTEDFQVNKNCSRTTVNQGFNNLHHPAGTEMVQSCSRKTAETQNKAVQEKVAPCRHGPRSMWSVDSPGEVVPVCSSSQQEDPTIPERRVSVPDILLSWRGGTPQGLMLKTSDKVLPMNDQQLLSDEARVEKDESVQQSPAETSPVKSDRAALNNDEDEGTQSLQDTDLLFKILRLPLGPQDLLSESDLLHFCDNYQDPDTETNPHADSSGIPVPQMMVDSFQMKRKMNESLWSVESLAPFIPNKEVLQQSSTFEPEVIAEMVEQDENGLLTLNNNSVFKACKERRHSRRISSSDSVPVSDGLLVFSTPAVKQSQSQKLRTENETDVSETKESQHGQSTTPSAKVPSASSPQLQSRIILSPPTREEADRSRSSEPEADPSPNQESSLVVEQKEKSPCSSEQGETLLLNSAEEEKMSPPCQLLLKDEVHRKSDDGAGDISEVGPPKTQHLSVPGTVQMMADVSPSKGHLVDCGVQCSVMEDHKCPCDERSRCGPYKRHHLKPSNVRNANSFKGEEFGPNGQMPKNQRRNGPWRHRGQGGNRRIQPY
ncbi:histone acetyltransferase KAT6A-like [Xyrichtys novacula]|uniref:Histone acetyltransferase KAT6A-like n=1 Tax=Xyrichtys novacula TaxID=13765 RepID=A0AAV1HPV6_XYRNO|nr:histone acetyltransferase KAT6A-like [Xyrichtys novacula]